MADTTHTHTVRRCYDLIDAGRVEDFLANFHDDVVYERQGVPDIVGAAAMRRFYRYDRVIAAGRHSLDQIIADGGWVAVRGRFTGTLKDGSDVDFRFTDWHHFRDGRIDHRETLFPTGLRSPRRQATRGR
ncbi:MAG TPA: nuclear transport factor 2 family protein [Jatrophihabitantaceae bacterium]|jgi:ketosteroid isomerase-like protein|nr:nuclear transport factor 2 family protein [Jatrophihabitantaceae bacterium]